MNLPITFWSYVTRKFFFFFFLVLFILIGMVFLIDIMEILKRSFAKELSFIEFISIVLYKLPYLSQIMLPFAILIGSALTLVFLNRNNELIVARSCRISAWLFLTPLLASAFLIGLITMTIINPFTAITLKKHEMLEAKHLRDKGNVIFISDDGIWLKDISDNRINKIIYAKSLYERAKYLSEVSVFIAGDDMNFTTRIEADIANIENKQILLQDVKIFEPGKNSVYLENYVLDTNLASENLQAGLDIPDVISFWDMPNFITKIEHAGFSALKHRFHFYSLLALPFFFMSVIIVSSSFSLSLPRRGKLGFMSFLTISVGFLIYFLTKIAYTLSLSGAVNIFVGVTAPVFICFFAGAYLLLHYEDG